MAKDFILLDKYLGKEPHSWPKGYLIDYPENLNRDAVASALINASRAVTYDRAKAKQILQSIDSDGLKRWFIDVAQHAGGWRAKHMTLKNAQSSGSAAKRIRPTKSTLHGVFGRDNYRCRYCGTHVVGDRQQFVALSRQLHAPDLIRTGSNEARHGVYLTFRASHDHLHPLSDGGTNDLSNLVTACWPCQFGKYRYTIQQLGLDLPKHTFPANPEWLSVVCKRNEGRS